MSARLISIIGPPASGKTTLAQWLAQVLPARLVLEDYAGNPFLPQSYLGQQDLALPAQVCFLFSRLAQLKRDAWPADGLVVSDYGFCQDSVYASRNLAGADWDSYRRLAEQVERAVKPPDVLIHLDAPEPVLLERIARRGRSYERAFSAEFLAGLRESYRQFCPGGDCKVIRLDSVEVNLLDGAQRASVLDRVKQALRECPCSSPRP